MNQYPSIITAKQFAVGDVSLTVDDGEPILVRGISVNNSNASAAAAGSFIIFHVKDKDANLIMNISVPARQQRQISIPFLADNGIVITFTLNGTASAANASAVVFHNHS